MFKMCIIALFVRLHFLRADFLDLWSVVSDLLAFMELVDLQAGTCRMGPEDLVLTL